MTQQNQTIETLFSRRIDRHINGVIKADQMDADSVWQELDEFVVTGELRERLHTFFDAYTKHLSGPSAGASATMGVWISGFFGSGKSHLLKVLAHLLRNQTHGQGAVAKQAVDFFDDKIDDPMLLADIKRAAQVPTDVILFNIDSKANAGDGEEAILHVFLRVLNELQGYSPDHPHIAHLERHLAAKGQLETFKSIFARETGSTWEADRDSYLFLRDEVIKAFSEATGQSAESAEKWIDGGEDHFKVNVEKLAQWTRAYLDERGPKQRLLFFVDEIGQFIGNNTKLMLNLQTITENLGTACEGRAWVVVTSQEDIDSVLNDVKTQKVNDFSKIQGRFKTKLSLSSANVDEVIQKRLLSKTDVAAETLGQQWATNGDQYKHQVALPQTKATFKGYASDEDFVRNYPFVPYQFKLLQNVFEAIRKVGASGQHLSRGERSILDAFQVACEQILVESVGCLVPLWRFYPAIEGFLDTSVMQTIRQAAQIGTLDQFDSHLLQSLFLIRYVKDLPGSPDNLVSLLIESLDQDRIQLKQKIKASLEKLEKESLVKRTGEHYFFLTNEERDIAKQIRHVELDPGEEEQAMARMVFEESQILGSIKKHRHAESGMDFDLHRFMDRIPYGSQRDEGLRLLVVSPLVGDSESRHKDHCLMLSGLDHGQVIAVLQEDRRLADDFRQWLKTDKYRRRKDDRDHPESAKRILAEIDRDNQTRKSDLIQRLRACFDTAQWYVNSQAFEVTGAGPSVQTGSALDYLVDSTYTKRSVLGKPMSAEDCKREIQQILRANDADKQLLQIDGANPRSVDEVRTHIGLCAAKSMQMVLADILRHFEKRPYAWPAMDSALIVARLLVAGELELLKDGSAKSGMDAYELLVTPSLRKQTLIRKRRTAAKAVIRKAANLGRDLFAQMFSDEELKLESALRAKLQPMLDQLRQFKITTDAGRVPGIQMVDDGIATLQAVLQAKESADFLDRFVDNADELDDAVEDSQTLEGFFKSQKPTWDRLLKELDAFEHNRYALRADPMASQALDQLQAIHEMPKPFGRIKDIDGHLKTVRDINDRLVAEARVSAAKAVEGYRQTLTQDLDKAQVTGAARERCLKPLAELALAIDAEAVLGNLNNAEDRAQIAFDAGSKALAQILAAQAPPTPVPAPPTSPATPSSDAAAGESSPPPPPPPVAIKPSKTIRAGQVAGPGFIETEDQAEAVLNALRNQIRQALADGHRVQIR